MSKQSEFLFFKCERDMMYDSEKIGLIRVWGHVTLSFILKIGILVCPTYLIFLVSNL